MAQKSSLLRRRFWKLFCFSSILLWTDQFITFSSERSSENRDWRKCGPSLSFFLVRQMWRWTSPLGEIFEILIRFWVFAGVDELALSGRWWIVSKCRVITLRTFSWKRGHRPVPTAKARARRSRRFRAHSNAHQWPRDKPARWLLHLFSVWHSGTSR